MGGKNTSSYPITTCFPFSSKTAIASKAFCDHGTRAPTSAQAMPSRKRYLARVRTESGISSSWREAIQVQSWLVTPLEELYALVTFSSSSAAVPSSLFWGRWSFSFSFGPSTPLRVVLVVGMGEVAEAASDLAVMATILWMYYRNFPRIILD